MDSYLEFISEKRFAKREVMFHGTSSIFLKSILISGLDPDPKEKSWDNDPDANEYQSSRVSVGGVYLTKNLLTSMSAAFRTVKKFGGNRLIVCVLFQPRSGLPDEDSIRGTIHRTVQDMVGSYNQSTYWDQQTLGRIILGDKKLLSNFKKTLVKNLGKSLGIKFDKRAIKSYDVAEMLTIELTRRIAYQNQRDEWNKWSGFNQWEGESGFDKIKRFIKDIPDVEEAEETYLKKLDEITRLCKAYVTKTDDFLYSARTLTHIGFKGRNRIIAMIELIKRENKVDQIKVVYGKPPDEFVDGWTKQIGQPNWLKEDMDHLDEYWVEIGMITPEGKVISQNDFNLRGFIDHNDIAEKLGIRNSSVAQRKGYICWALTNGINGPEGDLYWISSKDKSIGSPILRALGYAKKWLYSRRDDIDKVYITSQNMRLMYEIRGDDLRLAMTKLNNNILYYEKMKDEGNT